MPAVATSAVEARRRVFMFFPHVFVRHVPNRMVRISWKLYALWGGLFARQGAPAVPSSPSVMLICHRPWGRVSPERTQPYCPRPSSACRNWDRLVCKAKGKQAIEGSFPWTFHVSGPELVLLLSVRLFPDAAFSEVASAPR